MNGGSPSGGGYNELGNKAKIEIILWVSSFKVKHLQVMTGNLLGWVPVKCL